MQRFNQTLALVAGAGEKGESISRESHSMSDLGFLLVAATILAGVIAGLFLLRNYTLSRIVSHEGGFEPGPPGRGLGT